MSGLSKLLEAMQRMQSSFRKTPSDESQAVVSVLSDLIRLAAEFRAGDGERSPQAGTAFWVVYALIGGFDDRQEYIVALHLSKEEAQKHVDLATAEEERLHREENSRAHHGRSRHFWNGANQYAPDLPAGDYVDRPAGFTSSGPHLVLQSAKTAASELAVFADWVKEQR